MKKFVLICLIMLAFAVAVEANTIASSTMIFKGVVTNGVSTLALINEADEVIIDNNGNAHVRGDGVAGFDIYAKEGANARFGSDPGTGPVWTSQLIGSDHDAWPAWTVDTPDWDHYQLRLDRGNNTWALEYVSNGTVYANPMSGLIDWTNDYAYETGTGVYAGTSKIPGGAAGQGDTAGAWDMDWSWGSEFVPLEYAGFNIEMIWSGNAAGDHYVILTPDIVPVPGAVLLSGIGVGLVGWMRRRKTL